MTINQQGDEKMSTNTIISLLIFGVFAFMMFRGGGCCGSHGGHGKHKDDGEGAGDITGSGTEDHKSANR